MPSSAPAPLSAALTYRRKLHASCACGPSYTIKPGDSLDAIAKSCGSTVDDLAATNNIPNIDIITVGTVLTIPGCGSGGQVRCM